MLNPGGLDTAIDILNSGWITGLLLVAGLIGLYIEFTAPGTGIGGLTAAICFALLFWSHFLGGTAGWLEVVLFLLGITFVAVELFLLPGTMVAGITGAADPRQPGPGHPGFPRARNAAADGNACRHAVDDLRVGPDVHDLCGDRRAGGWGLCRCSAG